MQSLKLGLAAIVTLSLCACSTTQSTVRMERAAPEACLTKCLPAPAPATGSDQSVRRWEYDMIDSFGSCRRLHEDCANWHTKED